VTVEKLIVATPRAQSEFLLANCRLRSRSSKLSGVGDINAK
jgi:hypothetical protein